MKWFQKVYDLRIILKGGTHIKTKNVTECSFGETRWNIKWLAASNQNIAWMHPTEISGVEILRERWVFVPLATTGRMIAATLVLSAIASGVYFYFM